MDVKEYIASGILESVVLGFASDQERREVSCLSHIYPEIKEEWVAVESSFEKMAFDTAIAPAAHLREKILQVIGKETQIPAEETGKGKIVQFSPAAAPVAGPNPWKWMAAASIVLLFGVGALWVVSNNRSNELSGRMTAMEKEKQKDEQVLQAMQLEKERTTAIQSVLMEKSSRNVTMAGTPKEPTASVRVIWSANDRKAVMVAENITPPPSDMQYQLWAIADGKPVSLGVFNYDDVADMSDPFEVEVNGTISAFAITLEKRGGSPTPTMENMVVVGTVNS